MNNSQNRLWPILEEIDRWCSLLKFLSTPMLILFPFKAIVSVRTLERKWINHWKNLQRWGSEVWERLFLAEDVEKILKVIRLLKAETGQRRWLMFCSNQIFQEDESVSLSFKPAEIVTVALTEGTRYTYFSDRSYFYFELRCFSQKMILMKYLTSQPNQLGSNPSRYVAVGLCAIRGKVYV